MTLLLVRVASRMRIPRLCPRNICLRLDVPSSGHDCQHGQASRSPCKYYNHSASDAPPTTRSGFLAALNHAPCPPFEWPMSSTLLSGARAHGRHSSRPSRMSCSASTVANASRALGPCQSSPYVFLININIIMDTASQRHTHSVRPVGAMTQLCRWRGSARIQKSSAKISTPAPSVESTSEVQCTQHH